MEPNYGKTVVRILEYQEGQRKINRNHRKCCVPTNKTCPPNQIIPVRLRNFSLYPRIRRKPSSTINKMSVLSLEGEWESLVVPL